MKFISASSFWIPDYIVESAWLEHAPFAFWLMEAHRPKLVVELGTHRGFSYCCFCQAIKRLGLDAKAFAVDTWQGDEHAGFYGEEIFQRLNAYHQRYSGFSRLVRSSFDDAASHFENGSIDLLHIDGRHFYDDVKHDFETWLPKLSSRSLVLFHDTNVRERGFGVYKFWSELKESHTSFEFVHEHGLGVLGSGDIRSEDISGLIEVSHDESSVRAIRDAYARLGGHITVQVINQRVGTELEAEQHRREIDLAAERQFWNAMIVREREDSSAERQMREQGFQDKRRELEAQIASERQSWESEFAAQQQAQIAHCETLEAAVEALRRALNDEIVLERQQRAVDRQDADARFLAVYAELRKARRKPFSNFRRYIRWRTSRRLTQLDRLLSSSFVRRMKRREQKNSPGELPFQEIGHFSLPMINKRHQGHLAYRILENLAKQKWLFTERRISKFRKSIKKRQTLINSREYSYKQNIPNARKYFATESKLFSQLFSITQDLGSEYVLHSGRCGDASEIKAIAFYLPQFHPIPENDTWWGKGFTEWTNVSKAVPQFVGHDQPRLPDALGFYDLRLPEVQEAQIELAKQHGIHGFCFHYYWFSGRRRLLERPLNQYLANSKITYPFCICWANENWTRRWDGKEQDVLMQQNYAPEDDLEFIEDLSQYIKDERYIRIKGRPVILVYRVNLLPDPKRTIEVWREFCRKNSIGDPYLVAVQSFDISDPRPYGFDAAVEFPPHGLSDKFSTIEKTQLELINPEFNGTVYDYSDTIRLWEKGANWPDYTLFKTVMPGWDNQARRPGGGYAFSGTTPFLYRWWLQNVCKMTRNRYQSGDEKFVFINAWNEWAEGAYLEPDRRFGYAYLGATALAIADWPEVSDSSVEFERSKTAVICHLYYQDRWPEISEYLKNFQTSFDLYVTVTEDLNPIIAKSIYNNFKNVKITKLPNRGRDIGPFIEILRNIAKCGYSSVCKIHSKKSLHRVDGDQWFSGLMNALLGSKRIIQDTTQAFINDPKLGMVGPAQHLLNFKAFTSGMERYEIIFEKRYGIDCRKADASFFAGSMFWFRTEALIDLALDFYQDDFEKEIGQVDRTLAHFMERIFLSFCEMKGFQTLTNEQINERTKTQRVIGGRKGYEFARSQ